MAHSFVRLKTAFLICIVLGFQKGHTDPQIHNVIGCQIVNMERKLIRKFPGAVCAFLEDGRFASGTQDKLALYSPQGKELWSKDINVHHQLNLSLDQKKLLVLSSETKLINKKIVRADAFFVFDLKGNELGKFSVYKNKKVFDALIPKSRRGKIYNFGGTVLGTIADEYTHANSFYEIPENPAGKKNSAFAKGNFLINFAYNGVLAILDHRLKSILWSKHYEVFDTKQAHDAQILSNGNLLLYSNEDLGIESSFSSLMEINPLSHKVVWRYVGSPRTSFQASHSGGIQYLNNGNLLYSTVEAGGQAFEIDKAGVVKWYFAVAAETNLEEFRIQQIKRLNLSKFLANNSAL